MQLNYETEPEWFCTTQTILIKKKILMFPNNQLNTMLAKGEGEKQAV